MRPKMHASFLGLASMTSRKGVLMAPGTSVFTWMLQ